MLSIALPETARFLGLAVSHSIHVLPTGPTLSSKVSFKMPSHIGNKNIAWTELPKELSKRLVSPTITKRLFFELIAKKTIGPEQDLNSVILT